MDLSEDFFLCGLPSLEPEGVLFMDVPKVLRWSVRSMGVSGGDRVGIGVEVIAVPGSTKSVTAAPSR